MRAWTCQIARVACLAIVAVVIGFDRPTDLPSAPQPDDATAGLGREVRLRKLHLVRPDLIPYPISYEIYC